MAPAIWSAPGWALISSTMSAAALPSSGGSGLHDEERHPRSIRTAGIEQGAENFLLRGSRMDTGHRLHQATRCCSSRAQTGAGRGQLRQHAFDQFRLQLRKLTIEDLSYRSLDDLLQLLAIRHLSEDHFRYPRLSQVENDAT